MTPLIPRFLMMLVLTVLLSSCYSSKNLNKEDKPFTDDVLSKIEPGKRYEFKLKTGESQTIYVTGVADQTITGYYFPENGKGRKLKADYSASFQTIEENVTKIYLRKFSPALTTAVIVSATTVAVILFVELLNNMTFGY